MLHQTFLFLGQLLQLFEVSQILEFLQYIISLENLQHMKMNGYTFRESNSAIFIFVSLLNGGQLLKEEFAS